MALVDRLRRFFSTGTVPANTSREITPVRPADLRGRLFGEDRDRREIIRRCREMAAADPRADGMLRMMSRDAARHGFTVTVTAGNQAERAAEVAEAAVARLKMKGRLADWILLAARDGDLFLEPGVSAAAEIVEVTRKPTLGMHRLSDKFDRFPDPARAFAWTENEAAVDERAIYFPQFLMIHARWNHDSESRYGTPEFASARGAWRKLVEGETDLAVRRKTRAGIKYVHTLLGATAADIEEYKAVNEEALNAPFAAAADFFLGGQGGGITTLDGDPHLGELADIFHHLQTWSAASVVPLELLAFGENLNRDVLDDKKRQYDETLEQVRQWAAEQIVVPLLEREWLLAGILPETLTYSVGWPSRKAITPAELGALVTAVNAMRAGGWSSEAVWAMVEPYLPDEIAADTLFDGPAAETAPPAGAAAGVAETMGAVNRLLGRLEMAHEAAVVAPDTGEFWPLEHGSAS